METTIYRTLSGAQMESVFDAQHPNMMVKHFQAKNMDESKYLPSKKYKYKILIRHGEKTNADKLFDSALINLKKRK